MGIFWLNFFMLKFCLLACFLLFFSNKLRKKYNKVILKDLRKHINTKKKVE